MKSISELKNNVEELLANNFFIKSDEVKKLISIYEFDMNEFLIFLLPYAAEFARVPVSNFKVGAVVLCESGNIYFGSNMEFKTKALSATVHAEQSAVNNAWLNGETGINKIAVTSAPCGYCRQFLNELTESKQLQILLQQNNSRTPRVCKLSELLPEAFGPKDLGIEGGLMKTENHGYKLINNSNDDLVQAAFEAANKSYAPYTKNYSAVSIKLNDGSIFTGRYAENAAYNPSMSPLQSVIAFMNMNTKKGIDNNITDAVLVEAAAGISQKDTTETLLNSFGKTNLRYYGISEPATS